MVKFAQLPKYEAYKDSGVEWLGEIPTEWSVLANKHIFKLKKNLVGKRSKEYVLLSLTLKGIIKRDMENPEGKFPAEFDTYQEVNEGDFVFCLFDVEETPRTVGLSPFYGMITGAYTVFEPAPEFDRNFLYYFYLNLDAEKRLKPLYTGLRNTISKDAFLSFKTFVPTLDEQGLIANFLDQKTAQIDAAIAIKEQQIELLKERKQIIIQQAVTQGLDPNVPMKDSGVEWIGQIPEHWEVKKLKFLLTIKNGVDYKHVETDEGYPVYGSGGRFTYASSYLYDGEAVLLGRKGTIDKPLYVNEAFWTVDTMFYAVCNSRVMTKYIYFCATTIPYFYYSTATALPSMTQTDLLNHKIAVPSLKEQSEVIIYIEKESLKLDAAIDIGKQQIQKLKEYKTTLINSAVTGKIKITPELLAK